MNSLQFLYAIYFLSIFILISAMIVTAGFVIPLQFKQMGVKNGLSMLRKQLLLKGILSFIVCVIAIMSLLARFVVGTGEFARYVTVMLVFVFSICIFLKSFIDSQIYRQQYSEEHIEKANRIQDEMNKEKARDNRREVARVKLNKNRREATVERNSRKD